ncbi:CFEM domain-containing protein [Biscogniauxia marginata]|nr:CFEM domain-containing protein [Biscogniauxia marginata]
MARITRCQLPGDAGVPLEAKVDIYPYSDLQQGGFFILFFFPSVALLVVGLRVYGKLKSRQFGWDDALTCMAMFFSIAETGCSYMGMRTAYFGVHIYDVPPGADFSIAMKWNYYIQILYNPILALVKSSVLLFLLRIGGHQRKIRYSIHALNIFNIGLMIAIFMTVIFQCSPVSYFWERIRDPTLEGTCVNTGIFYVTTATLTIFTDALVLILPFWIFMGLKMPAKLKVAIMAVFLLGAIVTVVSVLRLLWMIEVSLYPLAPDSTYDIRFTYSAVETNLAIITASGPALRPLFMVWFPRLFSSLRGTSNRNYRYGGSRYAFRGSGHVPRSGVHASSSRGEHVYGTISFALNDVKGRSEVRSKSPTTSEERIMTPNRIVRTTEVEVEYGSRPPTQPEENSSEMSMRLSGLKGQQF